MTSPDGTPWAPRVARTWAGLPVGLPDAATQRAARARIDPLDVPPPPLPTLGRAAGRASARVCLGAADAWRGIRHR
jgi:hypothetical protein